MLQQPHTTCWRHAGSPAGADLPVSLPAADSAARAYVYRHGNQVTCCLATGAQRCRNGMSHGFAPFLKGRPGFARIRRGREAFQKFIAWRGAAGIKRRAETSKTGDIHMTDTTSRRDALKCLGVGAGTLFTLSGGVFSAFDMAEARTDMGTPLFLQISDTHIGFNKDANPTWLALSTAPSMRSTPCRSSRPSPSIPAMSPICPRPASSTPPAACCRLRSANFMSAGRA